MRRRQSFAPAAPASARLAWWAAFLATVALIAMLGLARSAQAFSAPTGGPQSANGSDPFESEELADEEEELEGEECEAGEEAEEECEEEVEDGAEAPRACLLTSAQATVSASVAADRVRLAVRYTAATPAAVTLSYWLRGSKGPLSLGQDHAHVGQRGVLHQTTSLSEPQMTKVVAAKDFTVQLRPAGAPSFCQHLFDRHLTVKHAAHGGFTWSDPEATASN